MGKPCAWKTENKRAARKARRAADKKSATKED